MKSCRSYGCVFKAKHRETGHFLAIKQGKKQIYFAGKIRRWEFLVPVESDLQEIVKEISIMKQCDSPYIVKYFGSYFKDADLYVKLIIRVFSFFLNRVEFCFS